MCQTKKNSATKNTLQKRLSSVEWWRHAEVCVCVMETGGERIRYHRRLIPRLLQTKCDGMLGAVWQREHTGKCPGVVATATRFTHSHMTNRSKRGRRHCWIPTPWFLLAGLISAHMSFNGRGQSVNSETKEKGQRLVNIHHRSNVWRQYDFF